MVDTKGAGLMDHLPPPSFFEMAEVDGGRDYASRTACSLVVPIQDRLQRALLTLHQYVVPKLGPEIRQGVARGWARTVIGEFESL